MLTSRQLAKELINRQNPTRQSNPDTSIAASSYEMVNPNVDSDPEPFPSPTPAEDPHRRQFWNLYLRKKTAVPESAAVSGRRVFSEPIPFRRGGMTVLRRFRFGRQGIDEEDEDEGDLTISTETDTSTTPALGEEPNEPAPYKSRFSTRSPDSGPSFISFPPSSLSSTSGDSPPTRPGPQVRPRNPTPLSASSRKSSSGQLAPLLDPPLATPNRAEAIRAITTEARFTDSSPSSYSNADDSGSLEYPSYIDTSSSMGGILRARNSRAPHNTPVQTVRFEESPRTAYLRRNAEVRQPIDQNTSEPLPRAQITQTSRWARLGNILHVMENDIPHDEQKSPTPSSPQTSNEPTTPKHPQSGYRQRSAYSASDSPISFARFDPPDPICSTPMKGYRYPTASLSPVSHNEGSPSLSLSYVMDSRGSSADVTSSAWSERFADEDGVVEVCSALEALWEYGSSSEEEGLSMVISIGPESAEAGQDIRSTTPASDCRPAQAGERRGSADLLPLKFKGYPKEVIEEPFPFASSLRF